MRRSFQSLHSRSCPYLDLSFQESKPMRPRHGPSTQRRLLDLQSNDILQATPVQPSAEISPSIPHFGQSMNSTKLAHKRRVRLSSTLSHKLRSSESFNDLLQYRDLFAPTHTFVPAVPDDGRFKSTDPSSSKKSEFIPRYVEMTAQQRKYRDLYGSRFRPLSRRQDQERRIKEMSSRERKLSSLESSIFETSMSVQEQRENHPNRRLSQGELTSKVRLLQETSQKSGLL
jgi:hypothetical protein